jgi:hypothetical protein
MKNTLEIFPIIFRKSFVFRRNLKRCLGMAKYIGKLSNNSVLGQILEHSIYLYNANSHIILLVEIVCYIKGKLSAWR